MKIGILTFHRAHNYGAMLQTYALQKYLNKLGHKVYVIDYFPLSFKRTYRRNFPALPRNPFYLCKILKDELFIHKDRIKRYDSFSNFMESNLNLYPYKDGFDGHEFDHIFIGSDQVWNKTLFRGFDKMFWGTGLKCKYSSYAASMAWYRPEKEEISIFLRHIENFNNISVRETDAMEYLKQITTKKINVVCDPTLLLSEEEWNDLSNKTIETERYVLCYNLVRSAECYKLAEAIAKERGCKVLHLVASANISNPEGALTTAGPQEFLSYFKQAEYVVTSSFHGTVFSLIFKKQFYSLTPSKLVGRVASLLNVLNLQDRMYAPQQLIEMPMINYDEVNNNIKDLVLKSKNFVDECLI